MSDLSSKPAHQEVDCRDDFDAVDVGRMAPPANDDDLLITTGDLLERPELKWTQLALASRLLVNRLCNLDVTKGNQLLEVSRFQEPSSHSSLAPICKFFSWDEKNLRFLQVLLTLWHDLACSLRTICSRILMRQQPAAGNVIDGTNRLFVATPHEALDDLS